MKLSSIQANFLMEGATSVLPKIPKHEAPVSKCVINIECCSCLHFKMTGIWWHIHRQTFPLAIRTDKLSDYSFPQWESK